MSPQPARDDLDLAAMRERLGDAEDLRNAIDRGLVDALVVGSDDDRKRVLLLSGAYGRYRQLVERMQQGAVTVARDGEIIFANESFAALVGMKVSDLFQKPLWRFVSATDRRPLEDLLAPHIGRREIHAALRRTHGGTRSVRISWVVDNDDFVTVIVTDLEAGHAPQSVAAAPAVPHPQHADPAADDEADASDLDAESRPFAAIVDSSDLGALITTSRGKIRYANKRFGELVGRQIDEVVGSRVFDWLADGETAEFASLIAVGHRTGVQSEVRLKCGDSDSVQVIVSVVAAERQRICLFSDVPNWERRSSGGGRDRWSPLDLAAELRMMFGPMRRAVEELKQSGTISAEDRVLVDILDRETARLQVLLASDRGAWRGADY